MEEVTHRGCVGSVIGGFHDTTGQTPEQTDLTQRWLCAQWEAGLQTSWGTFPSKWFCESESLMLSSTYMQTKVLLWWIELLSERIGFSHFSWPALYRRPSLTLGLGGVELNSPQQPMECCVQQLQLEQPWYRSSVLSIAEQAWRSIKTLLPFFSFFL